ncbi:MAG: signal peptidase II [Deltaproteobacteria bacterium]|nr:signal peptidase II [Deltaproteobacteria bacterium]MCB9480151.1 signal peptidase II [Deltaproteobacteria bacterium]MCB9487884.1 signal peptidase II [Deltaproteobacteria bacterium]
MNSSLRNKYFLITYAMLLTLAADQITKFWVTATFRLEESMAVVPKFFSITLKHNPGAAFGMFRGKPLYFFLVISVIAIAFILYFVIKVNPRHRRLATALAMILGGALGNISDRLLSGAVVDFLDVRFYGTVWPTFNVADMAIVVGVLIFMWEMIRRDPFGLDQPAEPDAETAATQSDDPIEGAPAKAPAPQRWVPAR